ncbi:TPA: hypothetical protein QCR41_002791 [Bacillus cereus]|nr:hypothetical protein [Bacillus cereus]
MKEIFKINLNKKTYDSVCCRIKQKDQLINIVLEVCSLLLVSIPIESNKYGECVINLNNRRIFFSIQDSKDGVFKCFSFHFPFNVAKENDIFNLKTAFGEVEIHNFHIAALKAIYSNGGFNEKECRHGILLDFSQLVETTCRELNISSIYEQEFNRILMELFNFEPSYIRYDYDEKNENGRLHPLNHLDIYYSQTTTFKLGCSAFDLNMFMNMLDLNTDCEFLENTK